MTPAPRISPRTGTRSRRRSICTRLVRRFFHPGGRTADVGCGSGREVAFLAASGFTTRSATTPRDALLEQARLRYPRLRFAAAALPDLAGVPGCGIRQRAVRDGDHAPAASADPGRRPPAARPSSSPDGILYHELARHQTAPTSAIRKAGSMRPSRARWSMRRSTALAATAAR